MTALAFVIPALAFLLAQDETPQVRGENIGGLRKSLQDHPDDAGAHYKLGLLLGKSGESAAAEREFRTVLRLQPRNAGAHFNLGLALIGNPAEKLDWSGAMTEFRLALQAKPEYPEARRMLAECLLNTGDASAAVAELLKLLQQQPTYTQARFSLACALEADSRTDRAIEELRQVIAEKSDLAEAHAMLGKLFARTGKMDAALAALNQALRINPDLADAHLTLARILRENHDPQSQIELAQGQYLARRAADAIQAVRLSNQGLDAASKGDTARAVELLRKSVETKPDYALSRYNLGLVLADSGDFRAAADELRTSASLGPALAQPWYGLGRVLQELGDADGALGSLERAAELDPEDVRVQNLARQLRARGARAKPPSILADTPASHDARGMERNLAEDWLAAVGEFRKALEMRPDFADARYHLALALYQSKRRGEAELELRKVLLLRSDAAGHYALGVILKEKGAAAARSEFEMAVKLDPASQAARHELDLLSRPR